MRRLPDPMRFMASGVPLSLLVDLVADTGPRSASILASEPADVSWIVRPDSRTTHRDE